MSDQPTNPKKIKDLKARLGRAPASGVPAPGGASGVPGPIMSGAPVGARQSTPGFPTGARPSVPVPMQGVGPGSVAPPPFVGGGDPFAAASPSAAPYRGQAEQRDVRIVVDDAAIEEAGATKKSTAKTFLILGGGLVLGLAVGWFVAGTASERKQYNLALEDAKGIQTAVVGAVGTVNAAKSSVDAAIAAAKGNGGTPSIAFGEIEKLRGLKVPFDAGQFARRRYLALKPETVDDLFTYYNNVNLIWSKIERLSARTLAPARRKVLESSAAATEAVSKPVGCVPSNVEGRLVCGLVFVNSVPDKPDVAAVSTRSSAAQTFEKSVAKVDDDFAATPDNFVILVDGQRSTGVLAQGASDFAQYVGDLSDLKALIDGTVEVQGRLEAGIGSIVSSAGQ